MFKSSIPINSFNAGELSGLIEARTDISKYASGCQTLENALPLVEGGAKKMPGTYYGGSTKYGSASKARLVSFSFSTIQNYILEFGNQYIRVWATGANAGLVTGDVTALSNYVPGTAYTAGQYVKVGAYASFSFTGSKVLNIIAPFAQFYTGNVTITIGVNTGDTLSVAKNGITPNQGLSILLANATPSKNSATNIQAAIVALVGLNGATDEYIDLTGWTVDANSAYNTTPAIVAPTTTSSSMTTVAQAYVANHNNQYEFPPLFTVDWSIYSPATVVEITTPYLAADLFDLDVNSQSADVLYIFHHSYPPAELMRYCSFGWVFQNLSCRGTQGPVSAGYADIGNPIASIYQQNPALVYVTKDGLATGQRIYMSGISGMVELNGGEFLVYNYTTGGPGSWKRFNLQDPDTGAVIDTTQFNAYVAGGFVVAVNNMFAATGDYPDCGTLFQQRLVLAGSDNKPQDIDGSVQSDYPDFICDLNEEDHAFQFTMVSGQVDRIRWLVGKQMLMIGTADGVWGMGGTNGASLSQANVDNEKQISTGVGKIAPQMVNDSIIWVTRSARVVRLLQYQWQTNQWIAPDLTRVARHITIGPTKETSGIIQTAFQAEPYPIFWAVRADGQLLGMTFESQEQVYAWFRIVTDGVIESVASVSQDNDEDQVWIIVNRTINGATVRYVEYFMPQEIFGDITEAFFVHAGLTWDGGDAVNITNISKAAPPVVTAPGHTFANGDLVNISGVLGMTQVNQDNTAAYTVTGVGAVSNQAKTVSGWGSSSIGTNTHEKITGFGFTVLSNAVIRGIKVQYNTTGSTVAIDPKTTLMKAGSDYGDTQNWINLEGGTSWWFSNITTPLGSSSDLWDGDWLYSDINNNSGFGVDVGVSTHAIGATWSCTSITITVYYTTNTFSLLGIDSTGWTAYASGGTATKVTNVISGMTYLMGKEVQALGDGAIIFDETVAADTITFSYYCNKIHIGLPYTTTIDPMNPNIGSQQGTSRGKKQKISRATLCFYETFGCKVGSNNKKLYNVGYGYSIAPGTLGVFGYSLSPGNTYLIPFGTGTAPTLFTGDITVDIDGGWDDEATITIVHDLPLPFTLKAIIPRLSVADGG